MSKGERNGQRKKRSDFPKRQTQMSYYLIVTDTDKTESNYIRGLKDSLSESVKNRIVIKVLKTRTKNLIESCLSRAALEPKNCELWILFDRDEVTDFDRIVSKAKAEGINAAWSNPCIEIWFGAYFGEMRYYLNSTECCKQFSELFYKKTGRKYQKSDENIYATLSKFGDEKTAVSIAEKRLQGHLRSGTMIPSEMCPCTTVQHLVKSIKEACGKNKSV